MPSRRSSRSPAPHDIVPAAQPGSISFDPRRGLRRLAACLDQSATAEVVLPHVRHLARIYSSHLTLLHTLEAPSVPHGQASLDALTWELGKAEAQSYLDRIASRLAEDAIEVDSVQRQGHAARQILCHVDENDIDLVALATHGEKGLTGWSLSSTAEKIVSRSPVSMLLIPAAAERVPEGSEPRYERILVLLDGSTRAESVLPPLERLASENRATLVLLHVTPEPTLFATAKISEHDADLAERLVHRNQSHARGYLRRLATSLGDRGFSVEARVERGDLREVVPRVIESENIDLVALTSHGRTGNRHRWQGSTAWHLLRHVKVPLLVIQNQPSPRGEFAGAIRHRRSAAPLRGIPGSTRS